jgi:hypothetical protein
MKQEQSREKEAEKAGEKAGEKDPSEKEPVRKKTGKSG